MVEPAQMLEFSAWDLPDPESVHTTLAEGIDKFQTWLNLYGKFHPEDRAVAEDLLTQLQRFVPKAKVDVPGLSNPYISTNLKKQLLELTRQVNEYVQIHDRVPTLSNSLIDTLTPTNSMTSTRVKGNGGKKQSKKTFEEEKESSPNTDFSIGDTMDIDQMLDISIPTDKTPEELISPASSTSPSSKTQKEGNNSVENAYTNMSTGVRGSEATRSEEETMEFQAVSKRQKQSSPTTLVHPRPTTPSEFRTISQKSSPPATYLTINPIQRKTPSSLSNSLIIDPIQREAIYEAINQHVLTKGAIERLEELSKWYFKNQMSGVKYVPQNILSFLQLVPLNEMPATATTLREASRLVEHDHSYNLMSELVRRYHLAIFGRQFEQRKKALEELHKTQHVPGVRMSTRVNNELLKETVFTTYEVMMKHVYRGGIWTGLSEQFGYPFLALVDLDAPKTQLEYHAEKFDVRHGFPDYIRRKHQGDDKEGIKAKAQQIISLLFFGHVSK